MILRSPSPPDMLSTETISAWKAIERTQKMSYPEGLDLVTQPSHAALAGEIAAKLEPGIFGALAPEVVRAISLHDSGWSTFDAQQIVQFRSGGKQKQAHATPVSFLTAAPQQSAQAWTDSIQMVEKLSSIGAYLVSSHFSRLAEGLGNKAHEKFVAQEKQRRERILKQISITAAELDRMVDTLQFCDELSLYLCCGAMENVCFPQHGGIVLRREASACVFDPRILEAPGSFRFATLHFDPRQKSPGSTEIEVTLR